MSSMKHYIGVKPIKAKPMTRFKYLEYHTGRTLGANAGTDQEGYLVEYPDGYLSWLPKEAFDRTHLELAGPTQKTN